MIPPRKFRQRKLPVKRTKPRRTSAVRCRAHVNWLLENFYCALAGKISARTGKRHECCGPLDPHHTPTRGSGGGDNNCVPLCRGAHSLLDSPGNSEKSIEKEYGVQFRPMSAELWDISPHGKRYRLEKDTR
jgi:hypothetical protein